MRDYRDFDRFFPDGWPDVSDEAGAVALSLPDINVNAGLKAVEVLEK